MIGQEVKTPNPREVLEEFLSKKNFKGKIIFAMIGGSTCYNLNINKSDFDFIGVYVAEPLTVLGMPGNRSPDVLVSHDPDIQLYEISKFCDTIITSSPVVLQMIFTSRLCYESDEWLRLKKNNLKFITNQTFKAYVGHAKAELKHLESVPDWSKPLYHAFRLLMETEKMAIGEAPRVHFDGQDRDFILDCRQKKQKKEEYLEMIHKKMEFCEKIKNDKMLDSIKKDSPAYKILDQWLIEIRLEGIKKVLEKQ